MKEQQKLIITIPRDKKKNFLDSKTFFFCNDINEACEKVDLVIIHTEWDEFKSLDFKKLSRRRKFKIYDMRNLYSPQNMKKQGFSYHSIGRQN